MLFDLNQLRYALCVSQHGSFSLAAIALGTPQVLLEDAVSTLEAQIGLTLFEPAGDGLRYTQRGAHFLHEAEHLLWRAEQVALRLSGARSVMQRPAYPFEDIGDPGTACACNPPISVAAPIPPVAETSPDLADPDDQT